MANIEKEYLVKRGTQEYTPISELFNGVRILKVNGFTSTGAPKNIYTAAWINSQAEDYMVTLQESREGEVYDVVIRDNTDIEITFIVGDKYADTDIDVRVTHDAFIAYMTDGALYVKSNYTDRAMKVVCLKEYKPTLVRLKRQAKNNYITGTITLHALDTRAGDDDGYIGNPYPTTSEEGGGGGGGEPLSINTTQVYDPYFGKTQQELNKQFAQGGGGGFVQQQADWAQTDASAVDYIKNKPNLGLYVPKKDDDGHGNMSIYGQGTITMTLADEQGFINQTGSFGAGGWSVSSLDGKFQTFGNSIYRGTMGLDQDSVIWENTATQQIPAATSEANGLMSASDKGKLDALPTNEQLTEELGDKADSADLAKVAISGSYNDLYGKPKIPTVPSNVSAFNNDAGYLTEHQNITGKADKVSNPTNGNFAALDSNGNLIDSGHKHSDYLTQHQSLTNYVQKSQTAGLLKNDGTVDTNQYLIQHQDISGKANKNEMNVVPGTGVDIDKITITLKQGMSATVLTTHQDISGKENAMPIATATGETLTAVVGNYYRLDNVGTLAITLPTIVGATKLQAITFMIACGLSALVTFVPQGSETILYQDGFALEDDTIYEVTALWNGSEWTLSRVIYK